MECFVEITRADGTSERFPLEGDQITLGRSGTAGVSLPAESQLELEHVLLAPRGRQGCWISIAGDAGTPVTRKGKPLANGMLKWESGFEIGSLKIKLTAKRTTVKAGGGTSPLLIIALVAGVGFLAWTFLSDSEGMMPSAEGMEAPPLFAEGGSCPAGGSGQMLEAQADSRGDRYPYDPRDGVLAVQLFRQAAACYRAESHEPEATRANRIGDEVQNQVEADYAARRLRLHHALASARWADVERDASALLAFVDQVSETENPWKEWLTRIRREAAARAAKEAR
ncbi:MAG: hypothetical protein OEY14_07135 [Myxococcales bacterium]|nr:hypothetical protein [Myxococcales bacterium]